MKNAPGSLAEDLSKPKPSHAPLQRAGTSRADRRTNGTNNSSAKR
jgi:hypothetical protein